MNKNEAEQIPKGIETIFFIDDEENLRSMSKRLLIRLGYKVILAEDGFEACQLYENKAVEIDLIILDLIMPKQSGVATFKKLREINPLAKILVVSGYSINGNVQQLLDNGAAGFIQKPFDFILLANEIRTILDN